MKATGMKRIPLNGTFELTARCNLRCKMCLIRSDNDSSRLIKEKSSKEWISLAEEVREAGTLGLLLTGGEPMLRPDFADIYSKIASMGFVITVYTNASLLTNEIYQAFYKYPPHNIGVTVYGASGASYKKVTGSYEAFDRMLEGVDKLRRLPSKLTIRTTIIKDNLEDLDKINSWATGLGPEVVFNVSRIVTMPIRGGTADVRGCRLSPRQNVSMMEKIYSQQLIEPLTELIKNNPEISRDEKLMNILKGKEGGSNKGNKDNTDNKDHKGIMSGKSDKDNMGETGNKGDNKEGESKILNQADRPYKGSNSEQAEYRPTLYGCNAGINSYTITWDGRLIGCQMLDDCCSYPFEEGFKKAWDSFPEQVKPAAVPAKCRDCSTPCTSCYATRLSETGNMGGWPEYICREAKLKEKMEQDMVKRLYASITGV